MSFESEYYQYNNENPTILSYMRYNEILRKILNHNKSNLADLDRILSNSKQNYKNKKNDKLSSISAKILKYKEIKID